MWHLSSGNAFLAIFEPLQGLIRLKKAFKVWKTIYVRVDLVEFYQKNNIFDALNARQSVCGPKNGKKAIGTGICRMSDITTNR